MNVFKELLAEVEAVKVSEIETPDEEITSDHTVVGEATTEIKQLLGLRSKLADQANVLIRKHVKICPPKPEKQEEHDRIKAEIRLLKRKHELVSSMLWYCVRSQFPETADKDVVSLHKDWKVAWSDEKGPPMTDFLSMGGGMGMLDIVIVGPRPRD